jgi:SAM-dependent methyltransferase
LIPGAVVLAGSDDRPGSPAGTSGHQPEPGSRSPAEGYAPIVSFFDAYAGDEEQWLTRTGGYHDLVERVYRFQVPPGSSVLEIGCGSGSLLASLRPGRGVGVDLSPRMIERARELHPELRFVLTAGEQLELGETFEYIVLSDILPFTQDLLALFERLRQHSDSRTRIILNTYSRGWRPVLRTAERLGLRPSSPIQNWVAPLDVKNLLELAGFEVISTSERILLPAEVPIVSTFLNGVVASIWPLNHLCLTHWTVARIRPDPSPPTSVSVICPCRNEEGHIEPLIERLPEFGTESELVFVEGGSTDGTRAEIERQRELHPELDITVIGQPGRGKADAVRAGFAVAKHDVLMILDGDLSVAPEELPKFYRSIVEGRGELINGSRLVYDMEPGAMRFLNVLGNKVFSRLLRAAMGQQVKDTLCGTKVLRRRDYEEIAAGREYFGDFDPFGDFDLLLGAARNNLKIVDLPVRYRARVYGQTNIDRWRHGLLLLRMTAFAFWKFKVALFSRQR